MSGSEYKHALPIGTKLDCYQIEQVIGSGGFGITYKALDTSLMCHVAIKEYLPASLAWRVDSSVVVPRSNADAENYMYGLKQFIREGQTLARFKHKNIVRVLRYFKANSTAYLVMEHEQGESLKTYLVENPTPDEGFLLALLDSVLDGLKIIHAENYLHRDIKPSNIYLRENGEPVLIDFGSARMALDEQSQSITHIVTEGYAPYEQYPGNMELTPATDLYALGATLYYAISKKSPVNALARFGAIQSNKPDPLVPAVALGAELYSHAFLKLIDWLMAVHPEQRPASVDVVKRLFQADEETSTLSRTVTRTQQTPAPPAAKPAPTAAAKPKPAAPQPRHSAPPAPTAPEKKPAPRQTKQPPAAKVPQRDKAKRATPVKSDAVKPAPMAANAKPASGSPRQALSLFQNPVVKVAALFGGGALAAAVVLAALYFIQPDHDGSGPATEGPVSRPGVKLVKGNTEFSILSEPAGAEVGISLHPYNEPFARGKTPYRSGPLAPGTYYLLFNKPGYRKDYVRKLELKKGYTTRLVQKLIPRSRYRVVIDGAPANRKVELLDQKAVYTGAFYVSPGKHRIRVSAKNHLPKTVELNVSRDNHRHQVILTHKSLVKTLVFKQPIERLAVAPQAGMAMLATGKNRATLINLETGSPVQKFTSINENNVSLSLTGELAILHQSAGSYTLDLQSTSRVNTFNTSCNSNFIWSPTQDQFACVSGRTLELWSPLTGRRVQRITLNSRVNKLRYAPSGEQVLYVGYEDHFVHVVDLRSGEEVAVLEDPRNLILDAVFFPDNRRILSVNAAGVLQIWRIETEQLIKEIPTGGGYTNNHLAISTDGSKALSLSRNHAVLLWNLRNGRLIAEFSGHTDAVTALSFFDRDKKIISAGHDKTVRIWRIPQTILTSAK